MILTVTLNPALDKTVEINDFKIGSVNRIENLRVDTGGKGINVSKVIKSLGGASKSLGILGGNNGKYIKEYLDDNGIDNDFIFSEGETRVNLKVVDKVNKTNTDINEVGQVVTEQHLIKVEERIFNNSTKKDILVVSGSVPQGVPNSIYSKWIKKARELGLKTILDADGELLNEGLKEVPNIVKPNIHELEKLYNRKINSTKEAIDMAKEIIETGVELVVVSLGGDGALFVNKDLVYIAKGLNVPVNSTVGAGDSMVAALAYSLEIGLTMEETIRLAMATSAANVMTKGTQAADIDIINKLRDLVDIISISNGLG